MTVTKLEKMKKFRVSKCWMRAESFVVLHGGLRTKNCNFLQNFLLLFFSFTTLQFFIIKMLAPDPNTQ
jgi:hypothetical protein